MIRLTWVLFIWLCLLISKPRGLGGLSFLTNRLVRGSKLYTSGFWCDVFPQSMIHWKSTICCRLELWYYQSFFLKHVSSGVFFFHYYALGNKHRYMYICYINPDAWSPIAFSVNNFMFYFCKFILRSWL